MTAHSLISPQKSSRSGEYGQSKGAKWGCQDGFPHDIERLSAAQAKGTALLFNPKLKRQEGHFLCSQESGFSPSVAIWVWEHSSAREPADLVKRDFSQGSPKYFFKFTENWW